MLESLLEDPASSAAAGFLSPPGSIPPCPAPPDTNGSNDPAPPEANGKGHPPPRAKREVSAPTLPDEAPEDRDQSSSDSSAPEISFRQVSE